MAAGAGSPYEPPRAMLDQGFGVQGVSQLPTGTWGRVQEAAPEPAGDERPGKGRGRRGNAPTPPHVPAGREGGTKGWKDSRCKASEW